MSARRVLFAFTVTFACALVVFTLPRFVFNTLRGATVQTAAQDTAKAQVVAPAEAATPAPRSLGVAAHRNLGIILILGIGVAFSRNRRAISRRVVAWGVGLQLLFAIFVLRVPVGQTIFSWLGATVTKILSFSYAGSEFVFGEIGKQHSSLGVVFAFQIMPAIIFVSALFAIMYYLGIMQVVVKAFAIAMNKIMGASGAESLNVAASIFMGQTEAPLTIRPFLPRMTLSELMTVNDGRYGARVRLNYGGIHRVRDRGAPPAYRGDHDGARHDHDGQDPRARDRSPGNAGRGQGGRSRAPT